MKECRIVADDLHYVPGSFYRICERTGFKVRAARTRKEWNNHIVREASYEPRQPQDLVRGVPDLQAVPEPRPRSPNVFLVIETTLQNALNAGATAGVLASPLGISEGDSLSIILANGEAQIVTVQSLVGQDFLFLPPLRWGALAGAVVIDVSAGALGQPPVGSGVVAQSGSPLISQGGGALVTQGQPAPGPNGSMPPGTLQDENYDALQDDSWNWMQGSEG